MRFNRFDVTSQGEILQGASAPVDITKLRSQGLKRSGNGRVLKLARLIVRAILETDTTAAAQDGIIPGKRWNEMFQRVQLAPQGWPTNFSHDCSGRTLRRQANYEWGSLAYPDGTDIPDSDATDLQQILYFEIAFWRQTADRPEDMCPPCIAVGEGDLSFAMQNLPADGPVTGRLVSARIQAEVFMGDDEVPVFTRLQDRGVAQNRIAFDLNTAPDRLRRALVMVNGAQGASTTHLAGSFEESTTVQFDVGDERRIEDSRIDELVQGLNRELVDQAAAESLTVPEVVPLIGNSRDVKSTKLPRGARDGRVEFSADPTDTATGTSTGLILVTDELYGAARGAPVVNEFFAVMRKRPEEHALYKVTSSKVQGVAADKADAVPWGIQKVGKE